LWPNKILSLGGYALFNHIALDLCFRIAAMEWLRCNACPSDLSPQAIASFEKILSRISVRFKLGQKNLRLQQ
jgi:hypothetical protein